MVDPADGEKITVPICMLASKDEPADAVEKFKGSLKVPSHVETFSDQIHGWMAARYVSFQLLAARVRDPKRLWSNFSRKAAGYLGSYLVYFLLQQC